MKSSDLPRRIISYEYCEYPDFYRKRIEMYNILGAQGWRIAESYERHFDSLSNDNKFTMPDGRQVTCTGTNMMTIFEREVHEFRTHT